MLWLRIYLLSGLILHKAVWEYLKRGQAVDGRTAGLPVMVQKTIKILILAGIAVQTMMPDILPIASESGPVRLAGMAIYTIGLITALLGRLQLGSNWSDIESAHVLATQQVVSHGLYRHIRHPIYVGDILLLLGLELSLNSWLALGVVLMIPFILWKAVREEEMLAASLAGYNEYRARTRRFIPFVF